MHAKRRHAGRRRRRRRGAGFSCQVKDLLRPNTYQDTQKGTAIYRARYWRGNILSSSRQVRVNVQND